MIFIIPLIWALLFSQLWLRQSMRISDNYPMWKAVVHWAVGAIGMWYIINDCLRQIFL